MRQAGSITAVIQAAATPERALFQQHAACSRAGTYLTTALGSVTFKGSR